MKHILRNFRANVLSRRANITCNYVSSLELKPCRITREVICFDGNLRRLNERERISDLLFKTPLSIEVGTGPNQVMCEKA